MAKDYEIVIGMEAHAQLLTKSKMFCGCSADYAKAPPNSLVCPICLGLPGSLPVINQKALQQTIMVGLALGCRIRLEPEQTKWDRKNYHYPDLPKGYQISQYDLPIAYDGEMRISLDEKERRIGVRRVHLEEDTAKLIHSDGATLIDFNRSGVPLIEVVTEPDIRSPQEAKAYVEKLRQVLRYLGVSSGNMEEGSLRLEANVSLRPVGSAELGTRTEIKNLNSFRAVERALAYEVKRQRKILEAGSKIKQETMGWDEARGVTVPQRSKEYAQDYRYFPEPDLPPVLLSHEWVEEIRSRLPELPDAKKERFIRQYQLKEYEAAILTEDRAVAHFYEKSVEDSARELFAKHAKAPFPWTDKIADWIMGPLFQILKENGQGIEEIKATPLQFAHLVALVGGKTITENTGKELLSIMCREGRDPMEIISELGLVQISDEETLGPIVERIIAENPKAVADYMKGKDTVLRFLIGQVAKATDGKADPNLVKELLLEKLQAMRQPK